MVWYLPNAVYAGQTTWSAGAAIERQILTETGRSGATLVEETGWLPVLSLGGHHVLADGYLQGGLSYTDSNLDYDGQSQNGQAATSLSGHHRLRLSLGYGRPVAADWDVSGHFEYERLDRDIRGVDDLAGMSERYRALRVVARLGHVTTVMRRPARVELAVSYGLDGRQQVASPGVIDPVELPMGKAWGIGGSLDVELGHLAMGGPVWHLTPSLAYRHAARSDNRPWTANGFYRGVIAQPETAVWEAGLGIRADW